VLLAGRNAGCDPRPDLAFYPTESPIGERNAGREAPRTFQPVPLGTRKPSDTVNLALAKETVEGKHCVNRIFHLLHSLS
jgi:hypothetical protein